LCIHFRFAIHYPQLPAIFRHIDDYPSASDTAGLWLAWLTFPDFSRAHMPNVHIFAVNPDMPSRPPLSVLFA